MANTKPRVVLTGATGFVGHAILRRLVAEDYPVLALVRDASALVMPGNASHVEVAEFTLENIADTVVKKIIDFSPDYIIHSAWIGTENTNRNNPEFVYANLQSCLRLLGIAIKAGCKGWIGFGSQAEYSTGIDDDITEASPTCPDTAYGVTKLAACHMLQTLCASHNIAFVWLRIFASYGKNYKASYVMPYLLDCFGKQQMPVLKTPHVTWDYIHVEDVAGAVLVALQKPKASGIFNLANGVGHSIGDIAIEMAKLTKFKDMDGLQKHIDSVRDSPTRRVADIRKIKRELGWQPQIGLQKGLAGCM